MVANETRKRVKGMYDVLKARLSGDLKHLAELKIEQFVWSIILDINKREDPKLLWSEFLAWGYAKNILYDPENTNGQKFLWVLCVFIDWSKNSRKDHDMLNHMSIAGKKDEKELLLQDAERHVTELMGDHPDALSDEAKEDIGVYTNRPAT